jgi:hypothetical protein
MGDLTKTDVAVRYDVALEVKAIHEEDPDHGMKKAAKLLARWDLKTLYEYQRVADTFEPITFKRISVELGPSGNTLKWTDYVGLTYVEDASDREHVRKQALDENRSIKTIKRKKGKTGKTGKTHGAPASPIEALPAAAGPTSPWRSRLCEVLNHAPFIVDALKEITALPRPGTELAPGDRQILRAVADVLEALNGCIANGVRTFREIAGPDEPGSVEVPEQARSGWPERQEPDGYGKGEGPAVPATELGLQQLMASLEEVQRSVEIKPE